MKVDAEPLGDDPFEIDAPPPDDAISLTVRATLDDLGEPGQLLFRQTGLGALGPVVDEAGPCRPGPQPATEAAGSG